MSSPGKIYRAICTCLMTVYGRNYSNGIKLSDKPLSVESSIEEPWSLFSIKYPIFGKNTGLLELLSFRSQYSPRYTITASSVLFFLVAIAFSLWFKSNYRDETESASVEKDDSLALESDFRLISYSNGKPRLEREDLSMAVHGQKDEKSAIICDEMSSDTIATVNEKATRGGRDAHGVGHIYASYTYGSGMSKLKRLSTTAHSQHSEIDSSSTSSTYNGQSLKLSARIKRIDEIPYLVPGEDGQILLCLVTGDGNGSNWKLLGRLAETGLISLKLIEILKQHTVQITRFGLRCDDTTVSVDCANFVKCILITARNQIAHRDTAYLLRYMFLENRPEIKDILVDMSFQVLRVLAKPVLAHVFDILLGPCSTEEDRDAIIGSICRFHSSKPDYFTEELLLEYVVAFISVPI